MANLAELFKLTKAEEDQVSPSELLVEVGEGAFTTTGTTVEISTRLTQCVCALITNVDPTYATNTSADQMYCDRAISSNAITVSRAASGKSGLKFNFAFIGYKAAVVT